MWIYIAKRVLYTIPISLGVSLVCFCLVYLAPGDPAASLIPPDASAADIAMIRQLYGFDQPVPVQFAKWLWRAAHGDFGTSLQTGRPVLVEVSGALANTASLAAGAALIAWWVGGVSWAQLVGAPDATYPRWVAATVLAVVIGAPVTVVPALLRGYLGDLIEKPWAGKWMLIVFAVVAGLAGGAAIWAMRNQLTGETWQVLAGWLAIAGPPVAAFFCLRLWAWTVVVASAALAPDRLGDLGPAANAELPE